jgi:DNA-binding NarL/FixJ family response regulator
MAGKKTPVEPQKTKVVLVDDHPIVRQGIRMVVELEPDLMVCGEAESAAEALSIIEQTSPALAIVDLSLKESSGLDLIKDVKARYPDVRILVLSMRDESFFAERVLQAGASGYITKDEGIECTVEGIRQILQGKVYLSQKVVGKMLNRFQRAGAAKGRSPADCLTPRELQVLELVGQGLPTREIAAKLSLSVKTVESHREHIKSKLDLDNAPDLLRYAIEWERSRKG